MKKIITIAVSALLAAVVSTSTVNAAGKTTTSVKESTSTDVRDKKGKLLYSVKRYDAAQLNKEVKSLVRSQYYDFDIVGVEEIIMPGMEKSIYVIHLQDDTHVKVVRIYNGELEVTGDYKRG